jgi:hypothetical protein
LVPLLGEGDHESFAQCHRKQQNADSIGSFRLGQISLILPMPAAREALEAQKIVCAQNRNL